jgi:hypothetical protein
MVIKKHWQKIVEYVRLQWSTWPAQVIGYLMTEAALLASLFLQVWPVAAAYAGWGLLAAVLVLDVILVIDDRWTISKWTQNQLKPKYDLPVLIAKAVLIAVCLGWYFALVYVLGARDGHFHWNGK